jgi:nucleotide-binding universal stress UspA family protein
MAYTHILATTDLSEPANHALRHAFAEAEAHGAELTLLHVMSRQSVNQTYYIKGDPAARAGLRGVTIGMPTGYDPDSGGRLPVVPPHTPEVVTRRTDDEVKEQLNELIPESFTGAWHVEITTGNTVDAILRTASAKGVDLIVMSTHGRTGLMRTFLGSVAEAVLHKAPCPVLVVRYGT